LLTASLTRTSASVRAAVVTFASLRACESATILPSATGRRLRDVVCSGNPCATEIDLLEGGSSVRAGPGGRRFQGCVEILPTSCEFLPRADGSSPETLITGRAHRSKRCPIRQCSKDQRRPGQQAVSEAPLEPQHPDGPIHETCDSDSSGPPR